MGGVNFIPKSQYKGPIAKSHIWEYKLPPSEGFPIKERLGKQYYIEDQLNELYEIFGEHTETLKTISALADIWIQIYLVWRLDRVNGDEEEFISDGLSLYKSMLTWIVEIGAQLDLDIYG